MFVSDFYDNVDMLSKFQLHKGEVPILLDWVYSVILSIVYF